MIIPTEADIGRAVVYQPHDNALAEDGIITSLNSLYVFVRYRGDHGAKATRREDLRWLSAEAYPLATVPQTEPRP